MEEQKKEQFDLEVSLIEFIDESAVFLHTERVMGKTIMEERKFKFISGLLELIHKHKGCTHEHQG